MARLVIPATGESQGGHSILCAGALAKVHARRRARGVLSPPTKTDDSLNSILHFSFCVS